MSFENINRRTFVRKSILAAGAVLLSRSPRPVSASPETSQNPGASNPQVITVNGPISPNAMGVTLPHEHTMSTFGGPPARIATYDEAKLLETVLPFLKRVEELGCRTLVECTAAYFGRAPALLKSLSDASGLHILTNTGYYGAANDRYIPDHARKETADQLAQRWLKEWREGIDNTSIRPGFIKIGVDGGNLSDIDRKLVRAAARTHLASGLTIAVHTGGSTGAVRGQLAVLREEGVHPTAWIWVHAQKVEDTGLLVRAAESGAWIEFDAIRPNSIQKHLELVRFMKKRGFLKQVLLSHDGNSFRFGGKPPRPHDTIFTSFIPALESAGFTPEEIDQLTVENPREAFTIRVRPGS